MSARSLLVRSDPTCVAETRHSIAEDLHAVGLGDGVVDDVVLIASELLGNAIRHAGALGGLAVSWEIAADGVVVQVQDHSERQPAPHQPDQNTAHGRGLAIVAALASEWGVSSAPDGKQVWARVAVDGRNSDR